MADAIQPGTDVTALVVPAGTDVTHLMGAPFQSRYTPSSETPASQEGYGSELGRYAKELVTGDGAARGQVKDYLKHEAKAFVPSALSAVTSLYEIPKAIYEQGPIEAAKGMGRGVVDTAKGIAAGDPDAVGTGLGMVVAPKVGGAALRGVNTAATAVAEKPYVQHAIGAVGGALAAKSVGLSPFIGMGVGRAASGLLKGPAEDVAAGSGKLMKILGMAGDASTLPTPPIEPPSGPSFTNLSAADVASLERQGVRPAAIARIDSRLAPKSSPTRTPSASVPGQPSDLRMGELTQKFGGTATAPDLVPIQTPPPNVTSAPISQPLGTPRVMTLKETPTSWTPESARARIEMDDWHSGADPGSPEAQRAQYQHREDAAQKAHWKYLMESRNTALIPGAVLGNELRKALLAKLHGDE